MPETRWIFANRGQPSETIVIHDLGSARALSRILKSSGRNDWSCRQECSLEELSGDAPAPRAPAQNLSAQEASAREEPLPAPPMQAPPLPQAPVPRRPDLSAGPVAPPAFESTASAEVSPPVEEPTCELSAEAKTSGFADSKTPPNFFSSEKKSGKRRHQRYDVQFRVIIVSEGRTFRTFSSNVSVGGMLLRQKVPAPMLDQVCTVFIGSANSAENIELTCRVVGDPNDPKRLSFGDCEPATLKRLESWILSALSAAKAA